MMNMMILKWMRKNEWRMGMKTAEEKGKTSCIPEEKYYVTHLACVEMDAVTVSMKNREEAEKIAAACNGRMCQVEKDKFETVNKNPPLLYNLEDLLQDAETILGYPRKQTENTLRLLHKKQLLTDPKTSSRYLTEDMGYSTEKLIDTLLERIPFVKGYAYQPEVRQVLDSRQVTGYPAIIPTMKIGRMDVKELDEREQNLLLMVAARLLMATSDPYTSEDHESELTCNYHTFYIKANCVRQKGYREIEQRYLQFFGKDDAGRRNNGLEIYLGKVYGPCNTYVKESDFLHTAQL